MIKLQDVSKVYGDHLAVDKVSLEIGRGQKHVLIGTSGSGKTTLLKMINKLVPKSSGKIFVEEKDTDDWEDVALRRSFGYVIQDVGLFPHYTIAQNIGIVPGILKWTSERVKERTLEVLGMVGLTEKFLDMYPSELSGGQQQRIGIARALAADPSTLLMDEPFGALDPITRSDLQDEFRQLRGVAEKTVILVTHDMMEAAKLGEVITVLNQGRVQQSGSLFELLFRPANDFVRGFLANQQDQLELHALPIRALLPWCQPVSTPEKEIKLAASTPLSSLPSEEEIYVQEGEEAYHLSRRQAFSLYYTHRQSIIDKLLKDDGSVY